MSIVNQKACWLQDESGFSLLEMLLALSAVAFISLGFVQLTEDYLKQKRALAVAQHLEEVHEAANEFAKDNFAAIIAVVPNQDDTALLDNVGGALVGESVDDLIANNYLPTTFQGTNNYSQNVLVMFRNVTTVIGTNRIEIYTLTSDDPLPEDIAVEAAYEIGGFSGVWSSLNRDTSGVAPTTNQVVNLFGMWSVDIATLNLPASVLPPDPAEREAHLFAYSFYNYQDELGDYLYRQDVGGVDTNVMNQPILMNSFNLDGVDNFEIAGDASIDNISANGVVGVRNNVTVSALTTTGNVSANSLQAQGGSVYTTDVEGTVNALDIDMVAATGALDINVVNGQVSANRLFGSDFSVTGETHLNRLTASGDVDFAAVSMDVTDMLLTDTSQLSVGEINANNSTDVVINGSVDMEGIRGTGNVTMNNGAVIEGNAVFSNVSGLTQFTCETGC